MRPGRREMSPSSEVVEFAVVLPADLHARPAGRLARIAAGFRSAITLSADDRAVDARSVLLVMGLGATKGAEVRIRAEGDDAAEAVSTIAEVLMEAGQPAEEPTPVSRS
jgi:phosphotransferase system HPr (HPr) family protein